MDDEEIAGADWQDGFDYLLADARAIIAIHKALVAALKLLVADVEQYEAWQRPCYALDVARATLKAAGEK